MNRLYFGDCLDVMSANLDRESVDLIYLDPPFNSKRDYNLLFKSPKGHEADAQITAFEDTWHWGEQAEKEFALALHQSNTQVAEVLTALRRFLGENDMMAYLTMMATRLLEMHRVLKPTGSLYLHCDPTASHYLKVVLDAVFGIDGYRTEISWKRQSAHNDAKQGRKQYGNVRDIIFFYTKSDQWAWNWLYTAYDESYVEDFYRHVEPESGRRYRLSDMTAPGGASPEKRNPHYEFLGVKRYWRYSQEKMEELHKAGRVVQTGPGKVPQYKRYLDEMPGVSLQNDWDDIKPVSGNEALGYPTQKPLTLLERIIQASSNEGDVILDPFCGCGTAVHAAEKLKRNWIGIDITHLSIALIEKRMKDAFPQIAFEVIGTPKDFESARVLAERDKYQFQWWACALVNAQPFQGKKKGADGGIDGLIYFQDDKAQPKKILVSVKGGENVSVAMIRDLKGTVEREKAAMGFFITLAEPTKPMETEAVSAGFYESPHFGQGEESYPKIQILTIKDLMEGRVRPRYPSVSAPALTFKKAKTEDKVQEQKGLFKGE